MSKECEYCGNEFEVWGRQKACSKECSEKIGKQWRKDNKEKIKELQRRYKDKNKEKMKEYHKKYHQKYHQKSENKAKRNEYKKIYEKKRKKEDPLYKLRCNYSSLFNHFLKSQGTSKKGKSCMSFISYTIQELKDHLESLWTEGMSWDNNGKGGWEIDHRIPSIFFNAFDPVEIKMCWSLSNLQPMWAEDNEEKGDKMMIWGEEVNARNYNNLQINLGD